MSNSMVCVLHDSYFYDLLGLVEAFVFTSKEIGLIGFWHGFPVAVCRSFIFAAITTTLFPPVYRQTTTILRRLDELVAGNATISK
jgi:hypothetical protein